MGEYQATRGVESSEVIFDEEAMVLTRVDEYWKGFGGGRGREAGSLLIRFV